MLRELKVEQRYDAVLAVIRDGMRITEVAEKFDVHCDTVHSWLARYEADGLDGRRDRSPRPKTSPLQMPAVIEARVLELRRNRPHWGPMSLRHQLAREGVTPLPSVSGDLSSPPAPRPHRAHVQTQAPADLQTLGAGPARSLVTV
jgi:transposase